MAEERQNFVYGNKEAGVPGCQANGISERTANEIYDEMADFAKYAFNKSHAACYVVVAYQTAWLKYHYPQEFMAALMTSVLDDSGKIAEYIQDCRQMKITIQPPDINEGLSWFSVKDGAIVYGLNAIKNVGRPVIDAIVGERRRNGKFADLRNFAERMAGTDVNKRAVENFIKAGAFDCFGATRRQMMMVYQQVMDNAAREHKSSMSGQMSLFDFMAPEEKKAREEYENRLHYMNMAGKVIREQMITAQKIASLLGETTAETKTTLTRLCDSIRAEGDGMDDQAAESTDAGILERAEKGGAEKKTKEAALRGGAADQRGTAGTDGKTVAACGPDEKSDRKTEMQGGQPVSDAFRLDGLNLDVAAEKLNPANPVKKYHIVEKYQQKG